MSSQRLAKCPEILQKGKNVHLPNFLSHLVYQIFRVQGSFVEDPAVTPEDFGRCSKVYEDTQLEDFQGLISLCKQKFQRKLNHLPEVFTSGIRLTLFSENICDIQECQKVLKQTAELSK